MTCTTNVGQYSSCGITTTSGLQSPVTIEEKLRNSNKVTSAHKYQQYNLSAQVMNAQHEKEEMSCLHGPTGREPAGWWP